MNETNALQTLDNAAPVSLTVGAVQRLIATAVEAARRDTQPVTPGASLTLGELKQWALLIREAGMIPAEDSRRQPVPPAVAEARAIAKIMAGQTWGINPFESQALMHFMDKSGQIVPDYKALLMRIKTAPGCDYRVETNTRQECTLVGYRNGREVGRATFTLQMAIDAGLYSVARAEGKEKYSDGKPKAKGAWEAFTADMLMSKAARRLFRDCFADLYSGRLVTKEDIVESEIPPPPAQIDAAPETSQATVASDPDDAPFDAPENVKSDTPFDVDEELAAEARLLELRAHAEALLDEASAGDPNTADALLKGRVIGVLPDPALKTLIAELG